MVAAQMSVKVACHNRKGSFAVAISYFEHRHRPMLWQQKTERPRITAGPCVSWLLDLGSNQGPTD